MLQQAGINPVPAAAAVSTVPPAVKRNPLYQLAMLGAKSVPKAAAQLNTASALLRYAKMAT